MTHFNLRNVKLRSGEEYVDEVEIELEPLTLGGQRYLPVPEKVAAELRITKATTGSLFQLAFHTRLHGPCFRCLTDTVLDLDIAAREYQATNPDEDEELRSPYVEDNRLERILGGDDARRVGRDVHRLDRVRCTAEPEAVVEPGAPNRRRVGPAIRAHRAHPVAV